MTSAQCALCKEIINSAFGFTRCKCEAIAVDDGRILFTDFDNVIEVDDAI